MRWRRDSLTAVARLGEELGVVCGWMPGGLEPLLTRQVVRRTAELDV
jgi:hypothetical protein